jgi:transglutaminase/protease-like cytokinesis protein 3
MKLLFSFFLLFCISFCHSQDYKKVDSIVANYPKSLASPKKIADRILQDFSSERDKARAIFTWITANIAYDVDSWLHPKPPKSFSYTTQLDKDLKLLVFENQIVGDALRNNIAVCSGYSLLYQRIAVLCGLECRLVNGMAKSFKSQIGLKKIQNNHAWNSVKIEGSWRLVDATWGAGSIVNAQNLWVRKFNPNYFDANPAFFFTKHFPNSGIWETQILNENDFLNAPLFYDDLMEENIVILEPKTGLIEIKNSSKITFKIKNLSPFDAISYVTNKTVTTPIQTIKNQNNNLEFDIDINKNEGQFLTLIVNNKSFVTFKMTYK